MLSRIPSYVWFYFYCVFVFAASRLHPPALFYLSPLVLGILLILRSDTQTSLLIILGYMSIEGAMKLFSGTFVIARLAIDFLIITTFLRHMQFQLTSAHPKKIFGAPYTILFYVHAGWIAIQFLNPFSLGLYPSIAAFKTYISPLLLYFLVFASLERLEDLKKYAWMFCAVICLHIVAAALQFELGERGVIAWSIHYKPALSDKFVGELFRPFGTSNVPGGASTALYLAAPTALVLLTTLGRWYYQALAGILLSGTAYVLLISQVRASQLKFAFSLSVIALILLWKGKAKPLMPIGIFLAGTLTLGSALLSDPRFTASLDRFSTLERFSEVWEHRSQGVTQSMFVIMKKAPFGIGLSRVGAGAGPFTDRIRADSRFGLAWSFADNLYKALLVEIGIPGLIIFCSLLFVLVLEAISGFIVTAKVPHYVFAIQASLLGAVLAAISGHMGSEGFLFQPECTFVWLSLGLLVKIKVLLKKAATKA